MELTKEEFSVFSLKSKWQLLKKDGCLIKSRVSKVEDKLIALYKVYQFYIEVIFDLDDMKPINIIPVINPDIVRLYG